MDKKNLEFASLLHDIGKFYYRTRKSHSREYVNLSPDDYGEHGAHAKWSATFLKSNWNSIIADIALYHHMPKNAHNVELAKIVRNADHHSSKERIDSANNDVFKTPLLSIFSDVLIKPENNKIANELYVPLKKLDLNENNWNKIIPNTQNNILVSKSKIGSLKNAYVDLWNDFEAEVKNLKNPFDFNTILSLLRKYTSTMPSASWGSKPDISLFDHSKTTSALAVCRLLYSKVGKLNSSIPSANAQDVYLVVNGDISGIQNFIFKISSPQKAQSGMSKRLRGRSLYLTLLTEAITSRIVKDLELTQANVLFCGGGRFTIIAPNTDNSKEVLFRIRDKINKYFIEEFNAELYLAIATESCTGNDLAEFGQITKKLADKTTEDKKHKFASNLNELFNFDEDLTNKVTCSVCGNLCDEDKAGEKQLCPSCKSHEELGAKSSNADTMIKCYFKDTFNYTNQKEIAFYNDVLKLGYVFANTSKSIKNFISNYNDYVDHFEIIKINDTNFLEIENEFNQDELDKISFSFTFMGNTVPRHSRYPLYFEHLAQISKGSDKLGVLKMDVDDLGLVFSTGFNHLKGKLNDDEDSGSSISRISTLSSQLDLFFSGFVNEIAKEYVVYSSVDALNLTEDQLNSKFNEITLKLQDEEQTPFKVYKAKNSDSLDKEEKLTLFKFAIPTIHINYSGGDDLLVLGPYDDIIDFGQNLRTKFKEWTCNNKSINLSGGVNIVSPKFPIGKAVNMSDYYLEASKSCGKDKITVFGETINWDGGDKSKIKSFNDLYSFAKLLEQYNEEKELSSGILYSLLYLWENYFEEHSGIFGSEDQWVQENLNKINNHQYIPKFTYKLRVLNSKSKVYNDLMKGRNNMPWINVPVSWVSLRMR